MLVAFGCLLTVTQGQSEPEESGEEWELFVDRFWRPLPVHKVTKLKEQQTLAYGHHLQEPENIKNLVALGSFHFHLLEFDQAAAWYFRVLELEPGNADALAWYAECLYHAGSIELALPILERLDRLKLAKPVSQILRAEIYYRTDQMQEAKGVLEQVVHDLESGIDDPAFKPFQRFAEHAAHNLKVVQL